MENSSLSHDHIGYSAYYGYLVRKIQRSSNLLKEMPNFSFIFYNSLSLALDDLFSYLQEANSIERMSKFLINTDHLKVFIIFECILSLYRGIMESANEENGIKTAPGKSENIDSDFAHYSDNKTIIAGAATAVNVLSSLIYISNGVSFPTIDVNNVGNKIARDINLLQISDILQTIISDAENNLKIQTNGRSSRKSLSIMPNSSIQHAMTINSLGVQMIINQEIVPILFETLRQEIPQDVDLTFAKLWKYRGENPFVELISLLAGFAIYHPNLKEKRAAPISPFTADEIWSKYMNLIKEKPLLFSQIDTTDSIRIKDGSDLQQLFIAGEFDIPHGLSFAVHDGCPASFTALISIFLEIYEKAWPLFQEDYKLDPILTNNPDFLPLHRKTNDLVRILTGLLLH